MWVNCKDRLPAGCYECVVWYTSYTLWGPSKGWGLSWWNGHKWYEDTLEGDEINVLYWQRLTNPEEDINGREQE